MGDVIQLADRRQPAPTPKPERTLERSVELALVLALFDAVSAEVRAKACDTLWQIGKRCPDCEASQQAADLAVQIMLAGEA